jgi:hypothetical protein
MRCRIDDSVADRMTHPGSDSEGRPGEKVVAG